MLLRLVDGRFLNSSLDLAVDLILNVVWFNCVNDIDDELRWYSVGFGGFVGEMLRYSSVRKDISQEVSS